MNIKIEVTHEGQTFLGEVELIPSATRGKHHSAMPSNKRPSEPIKKPSVALEHLYRKNFFREPQMLPETWDELRNSGFNFSRSAVLMALQAAEYLTMTGKRGSYRFVQKYPPTLDI